MISSCSMSRVNMNLSNESYFLYNGINISRHIHSRSSLKFDHKALYIQYTYWGAGDAVGTRSKFYCYSHSAN